MNKKITILVIIICTLVVGIGVSLAYFAVNNQNDGNETNLNITTERLGSILWTGTKVFTSYDLLPGQIGVQEFTIEKNSEQGTGIYEIDLAGVLPSEFGTDIEISLYKTTDPISNNITVDVADPTLENEQLYQEDSLNITGTPELVYQGTLTNNSQIILDQADFDVSTLEKTTYYLVYHYKNNGNQDNQQGLSFSGTISVRIINEKMSFSDALALCDDTASNCMLKNAEKSEELVYDETVDNNLRYIGADPSNYVSFNNELWRIIGVMNNMELVDGTTGQSLIKLIRSESIGAYVWDYNSDGTYDNDWTASTLMELLNNGAYYYRDTGSYYNNSTTPITVDFTNIGLKEESRDMIESVLWHIGGSNTDTDVTVDMFYERERGITVYNGRPITWAGKVGLMYPSDYGYATSGGSVTDRATCFSTRLSYWGASPVADCKNNNWLYNNDFNWTITSNSSNNYYVFYTGNSGDIYNYYVNNIWYGVTPVIYLVQDIKFVSGTGSSSDPFELSIAMDNIN